MFLAILDKIQFFILLTPSYHRAYVGSGPSLWGRQCLNTTNLPPPPTTPNWEFDGKTVCNLKFWGFISFSYNCRDPALNFLCKELGREGIHKFWGTKLGKWGPDCLKPFLIICSFEFITQVLVFTFLGGYSVCFLMCIVKLASGRCVSSRCDGGIGSGGSVTCAQAEEESRSDRVE